MSQTSSIRNQIPLHFRPIDEPACTIGDDARYVALSFELTDEGMVELHAALNSHSAYMGSYIYDGICRIASNPKDRVDYACDMEDDAQGYLDRLNIYGWKSGRFAE